ncbi:MAG: ComF family protein [Capsulimonadaceae bacterium]|nr:ComF family protein [Capsulimonadaceae bacterium]
MPKCHALGCFYAVAISGAENAVQNREAGVRNLVNTYIAPIQAAADAFLWLVYPDGCMICKEASGPFLCDRCADDLLVPFPALVCSTCGHPRQVLPCRRCQMSPPAYVATRAASPLAGELAQVIHHFKYHDRPQLALPLGRLLARHALGIRHSLGDLSFDRVTCVPMLRSRERARGYNQADRLARVTAAELRLSYAPDLLKRAKRTRPQVGLHREQRQSNIEGAFVATGKPSVTGLRILVIDDVSTTGATLDACAVALREAGAAAVYGLALAAGG